MTAGRKCHPQRTAGQAELISCLFPVSPVSVLNDAADTVRPLTWVRLAPTPQCRLAYGQIHQPKPTSPGVRGLEVWVWFWAFHSLRSTAPHTHLPLPSGVSWGKLGVWPCRTCHEVNLGPSNTAPGAHGQIWVLPEHKGKAWVSSLLFSETSVYLRGPLSHLTCKVASLCSFTANLTQRQRQSPSKAGFFVLKSAVA